MCARGAGASDAHHLVEENAKGPVVDGLAVALLEDDLGREILGRAAERPAAVLDVLGEAEVGQLERAVLVKQSRGAYGRSQ